MAGPAGYVTYLNGQVMPHREAMAALQEGNLGSAGGFYDHERTFNGRVFKLRQHLERLYRGLAVTQIDPGVSVEEMEAITANILEANLPLLREGDEFEVTQIVSVTPTESPDEKPGVNVVVYCQPLNFTSFAIGYIKGVRVVTPSTYAVPAQTPRSGATPVEQKVMPLMTSREGSITECKGGNFMLVRDGRIKLPDRRNVLPGVSMETVLELAKELEIEVDEGDYSIYDVYMASEVFVSATTYCVQPVQTINGFSLGDELPGPVTGRMQDAWREMIGVDFVQQALDHLLPETGPARQEAP